MRTRILLVEDEPAIPDPLAESLGRDGFKTAVAATLSGAREALRREAPNFALLDVMLPDGDGRDLARGSARSPTSRSSCSRPEARRSIGC